MEEEEIKGIIKKGYKEMSEKGCCGSKCACDNSKTNENISKSIGYSEDEIETVPEANLGLGCGNPTALANIKEGDIVLDLGSGAGFDAFLASKKVGDGGKVIGVDLTEEMISKSKMLANKYGYKNVEFKLGDIEELPLEEKSVDIIISNCVINLAPNKQKVFDEARRVLKDSGKMFVSDIVLLEELDENKKKDEKLLCGCVGGALLKEDYLKIIEDSGLKFKILDEDRRISKEQYHGINLMSLKLEISKDLDFKPTKKVCMCCSK